MLIFNSFCSLVVWKHGWFTCTESSFLPPSLNRNWPDPRLHPSGWLWQWIGQSLWSKVSNYHADVHFYWHQRLKKRSTRVYFSFFSCLVFDVHSVLLCLCFLQCLLCSPVFVQAILVLLGFHVLHLHNVSCLISLIDLFFTCFFYLWGAWLILVSSSSSSVVVLHNEFHPSSVSPVFLCSSLFSFHPPTFAPNLFTFSLLCLDGKHSPGLFSMPKCQPLIAFCRLGSHTDTESICLEKFLLNS